MGRKEHTIHSFYFSQGKGSAVCNLHQFWHFVVKRRFWTIFLEQHAFWKNFDHKIIFFLLHVFMFSKQMTKCETVSFIRDCIFRNYPSQRRHRQHVNTNTIQKDNINVLWNLASLCNLICSASSLPHAALYSSALFHYYMINDDHHDPNPRSMP